MVGWYDLELEKSEKDKDKFEMFMKTTFEYTESDSLFILEDHLLDHLVIYLKHFRTIYMLNSAPFEHFNHFIKMA